MQENSEKYDTSIWPNDLEGWFFSRRSASRKHPDMQGLWGKCISTYVIKIICNSLFITLKSHEQNEQSSTWVNILYQGKLGRWFLNFSFNPGQFMPWWLPQLSYNLDQRLLVCKCGSTSWLLLKHFWQLCIFIGNDSICAN